MQRLKKYFKKIKFVKFSLKIYIFLLGAEEMVENLTTKCLNLEDKYNLMLEERADLEKLHEMDDELQENARELELELREDLDFAQSKIRQLEKSREVAFDVISDHEATILKFRDLVNKVQEQNSELRSTLESKKPEAAVNNKVASIEMIDFKKMLADTKAYSKVVSKFFGGPLEVLYRSFGVPSKVSLRSYKVTSKVLQTSLADLKAISNFGGP
jgi:myosin heavy subunit